MDTKNTKLSYIKGIDLKELFSQQANNSNKNQSGSKPKACTK